MSVDPAEKLGRVLDALRVRTGREPVRSGRGWLCCCPAHEDAKPSLSVCEGHEGVLLRCFGGCELESIVAALGLKVSDLFYDEASKPADRPTDPRTELERLRLWEPGILGQLGATVKERDVVFPMFDAKGRVVGQKVRRGDGRAIKVGEAETKSLTRKYTKTGLLFVPPLPPDGLALVVEGEADWAAAVSAGWLLSVATPGATVGHAPLRWLGQLLHGREVVLAPHGDEAGVRWRDAVGKMLAGAQCKVGYILPEPKRDLDDRLRLAEDRAVVLRGLVEEALPWRDPAEDTAEYFDGRLFVPLGLAQVLAGEMQLCFGFDPASGAGRLMRFSGGVWRPAVDLDVTIQERLGRATRDCRVQETLKALARLVERRSWFLWNPNRAQVNCLSGMLDPVTGELREHRAENWSTFQVPVTWDKDAVSDKIEAFLLETLPEDCLPLVCQVLGYLLVPVLESDKMILIHGPALTGKTTFLELVLALLGPDNWAMVGLHDLAENRFASAELENKLASIFDDLDSVPLRSASLIKALSGGLPWLRVERKGADSYRAPLYARLLFSCNEVPTSPDKGTAWYRRLVILPFLRVVPIEKRDPLLSKRLTEEANLRGLLRLAVAGLRQLIGQNWQFSEPESVAEQLREYKIRNDSVAEFVEEACELDAQAEIDRARWYRAYSEWCLQAGHRATSRRRAYERLGSEFGCTLRKTATTRVLVGIDLAAGVSPTVQATAASGQRTFEQAGVGR